MAFPSILSVNRPASAPALRPISERTFLGIALLVSIVLYAALDFAGKDSPRLLDLAYGLGCGLAGVALPRHGTNPDDPSGNGGAISSVTTTAQTAPDAGSGDGSDDASPSSPSASVSTTVTTGGAGAGNS